MLPITINGTAHEIPSQKEELTLRQYKQLTTKEIDIDPAYVFAVLTGIDYKTLKEDCNIDSFTNNILPTLTWLWELDTFHNNEPPAEILIGETLVKVPKDIKQETYAQKLILQMKLNDHVTNNTDYCDTVAYAVALYLQSGYTGTEYDDTKAEALVPLIYQCKAYEVIAIASFFLHRCKSFINSNPN